MVANTPVGGLLDDKVTAERAVDEGAGLRSIATEPGKGVLIPPPPDADLDRRARELGSGIWSVVREGAAPRWPSESDALSIARAIEEITRLAVEEMVAGLRESEGGLPPKRLGEIPEALERVILSIPTECLGESEQKVAIVMDPVAIQRVVYSMLGGDTGAAIADGIVDGLTDPQAGAFSADNIEKFVANHYRSLVTLNLLYPSVAMAGVACGVLKGVWDTLTGLIQLLGLIPRAGEICESVLGMLEQVSKDEEKAHELGYFIGVGVGADLVALAGKTNPLAFAFSMHVLIGPLVIEIVIAATGVGTGVVAAKRGMQLMDKGGDVLHAVVKLADLLPDDSARGLRLLSMVTGDKLRLLDRMVESLASLSEDARSAYSRLRHGGHDDLLEELWDLEVANAKKIDGVTEDEIAELLTGETLSSILEGVARSAPDDHHLRGLRLYARVFDGEISPTPGGYRPGPGTRPNASGSFSDAGAGTAAMHAHQAWYDFVVEEFRDVSGYVFDHLGRLDGAVDEESLARVLSGVFSGGRDTQGALTTLRAASMVRGRSSGTGVLIAFEARTTGRRLDFVVYRGRRVIGEDGIEPPYDASPLVWQPELEAEVKHVSGERYVSKAADYFVTEIQRDIQRALKTPDGFSRLGYFLETEHYDKLHAETLELVNEAIRREAARKHPSDSAKRAALEQEIGEKISEQINSGGFIFRVED